MRRGDVPGESRPRTLVEKQQGVQVRCRCCWLDGHPKPAEGALWRHVSRVSTRLLPGASAEEASWSTSWVSSAHDEAVLGLVMLNLSPLLSCGSFGTLVGMSVAPTRLRSHAASSD